MNMRIALLSCLLAAGMQASIAQPAAHGAPVPTRFVKVFLGLENQLAGAARSHDEAALSKLLAANFEQRDGAAPGRPLPRAEWLQLDHPAVDISQMAVHEYGNVAVVSFAEATQHAFIVDVWSKTGDDYALSVRYASAAAAMPQTKPENPAK